MGIVPMGFSDAADRIARLFRLCVFATALGMLGGCGSLFPTGPAEQAADKILDDILGKSPRQMQASKPVVPPQ